MRELILTFFYSGKAPKAPGTFGSIGGVIFGLILTKIFFLANFTIFADRPFITLDIGFVKKPMCHKPTEEQQPVEHVLIINGCGKMIEYEIHLRAFAADKHLHTTTKSWQFEVEIRGHAFAFLA